MSPAGLTLKLYRFKSIFCTTSLANYRKENFFYMYLYLNKITCKRKIFYVYKDQQKTLPHRYAFICIEIDSDYGRSSTPHGKQKTL